MFVQTFRSYFREEIFYGLCLNGSMHRHAYLSKNAKLINQTKTKNENKGKTKGHIYIIYKGSNQAKYLFRAWPFTG